MKNNIMIFTINDLTLRGTKIKHINNGCVYTTCLRPTPNVFYSLQNPSRQTIQKVFSLSLRSFRTASTLSAKRFHKGLIIRMGNE